jgi:hypothetical protein
MATHIRENGRYVGVEEVHMQEEDQALRLNRLQLTFIDMMLVVNLGITGKLLMANL